MTNADILARFPGPVPLKPPRWKYVLSFVFFGLLAVAGIGNPIKFKMWFALLVFAPIALMSLMALLPWANALTLRGDRLQWSYGFRRWTIPWSHAHSFAVSGLGEFAHVIFRHDRKGDAGMAWLGGRNVALTNRFGKSPEELAALLMQWRELALAAQGATAPTPAVAPPAAEAPVTTALSKAGADLLARYPGPVVLSHWSAKWTWPVLIVSLLLVSHATTRVWEISATAGSFMIVAVLAVGILVLRASGGPKRALTLSSDGFEVARGFYRYRCPWRSAQDFIAVRSIDKTRVAFNVMGEPSLWAGERADRPPSPYNTPAAMVFRTATLAESYGLPDDELAVLMTHWRERALAGGQRAPADADADTNALRRLSVANG